MAINSGVYQVVIYVQNLNLHPSTSTILTYIYIHIHIHIHIHICMNIYIYPTHAHSKFFNPINGWPSPTSGSRRRWWSSLGIAPFLGAFWAASVLPDAPPTTGPNWTSPPASPGNTGNTLREHVKGTPGNKGKNMDKHGEVCKEWGFMMAWWWVYVVFWPKLWLRRHKFESFNPLVL